MSGPRRIGVLGGTFDPPHIGHLVTALDVRHLLRLDVVLMVVANVPWQKVGERRISGAADRLAMVTAAVGELDGVEASDIEIRRGGPSYTAETLESLSRDDPGAELFLILGSDAAAQLHTWERPDVVAAGCTVVVVERPGAPSEPVEGFDSVRLEVPRLEVSSTDLRDRVADGRPLRFLVPDPVISLIHGGGLYGETE